MSSSPFLQYFLARTPRDLPAPTLALELRETIARWFSARDKMQSSELILAALADLVAEQITANPTRAAQVKALDRFMDETVRVANAAIRRQLGGMQVTIVKQ